MRMGKRSALYADLEALPENMVGEILAGVLYASPRPAIRHARTYSRLGVVLGGPFDVGPNGPGGWHILDEPELHLDEDVLVPDLAGWRRERLPELPDDAAAMTLAPDWVCEVLSPHSTATRDRNIKMPIYAREGVAHVWLVDPDARTLEVFRLTGPHYTALVTYAETVPVRAEPFEALEFPLGVLWGE